MHKSPRDMPRVGCEDWTYADYVHRWCSGLDMSLGRWRESPLDMPRVGCDDWTYAHYVHRWCSGLGMSLKGWSAREVHPFRSPQLEHRGAARHGREALGGVVD